MSSYMNEMNDAVLEDSSYDVYPEGDAFGAGYEPGEDDDSRQFDDMVAGLGVEANERTLSAINGAIANYADAIDGMSFSEIMASRFEIPEVNSPQDLFDQFSAFWAEAEREWEANYGSMNGYQRYRDLMSSDGFRFSETYNWAGGATTRDLLLGGRFKKIRDSFGNASSEVLYNNSLSTYVRNHRR